MNLEQVRKRTKQLIAEAQSDSQREIAELLDAMAEAMDASGANATPKPKTSARPRGNTTKSR